MAYQSKKHRKFLATSLTAAMVASAVAPAVGFAAEFKDVKEGSFYHEYVKALSDAKIIDGRPDGSFDLGGKVTRAEASKMIANILKLDTEKAAAVSFADVDQDAWYAKYVNALYAAKLIDGKSETSFDPNGTLTRAEFAKMVVAAYKIDTKKETEVPFTDLAEGKWYVEYVSALYAEKLITGTTATTFSPDATVKRADFAKLLTESDWALGTTLPKKETPVTNPEVTGVSATNLKEVVVTFNTAVDEETGSDKANYSLKSGKAVKSVVLSEDKKTATVTVTGTLTNNKADAVSVANVKAGDKVLNAKNVEFTAVDNKLPEVTSLKSLGTKSVKLVFTEPVTDLKQSNFTLDGKAFFGKVVLGANDRSVILTPFSSTALSVGDHKLTATGVKDFAGFVSLTSTHDFTVVEDKEAPTVTEATATLETVTLTFSEDVDAETVKASNVYWKSGDSKKVAYDFEALEDNKYKFYFTNANSLPTGKVDINVEGVKDYSGNQIAKDSKVTVTPEIDQTRPEVRKVAVEDSKTIKVTFSKAINEDSAEEVKNYTVLNKDGKVVSVQSAALDPKDSKSVIVKLYTDLSVGENTLTIKNIKDATKLQNTMLDYSEKIVRADKNAPTFDFAVNTTDNRVVLKFNKKMDVDTLVDYSNYLVQVNGSLRTLTADMADISVMQDGTAVIITFAETIGGNDVVFTSATTPAAGKVNINTLNVLGVKDAAGNLLSEFANPGTPPANVISLNTSTSLAVTQFDADDYPSQVAELIDSKTIKVHFNTGVTSSSTAAFTAKVNGTDVAIDSVQIDGTSEVIVKFKNALKTDALGLVLKVDYSELVDIAGNKGSSFVNVQPGTNLLDSVKPEIADNTIPYAVATGSEKIVLTYSEALQHVAGAAQDLRDADFKIVRISDNKTLNPIGDYDVAVGAGANNNKIEITLSDTAKRDVATAYRIEVKDAKYFKDVTGNVITDSVGESVQVTYLVTNALSALNTLLDAAGTATAADYAAVGITGVTSANEAAINTVVEAGKVPTVDLTKAQIQTLVNTKLGALTSFTAVTLTQTGTVTGGNVQYATAANVIAALPTTIAVTLFNGDVVNVPVTWADTDTYNAGAAATYTFTATWGTMPAGANNSESLAVPTVDLVVAP